MSKLPDLEACHLRYSTKTGTQMSLPPLIVNGADMGTQEWRDTLFIRQGIDPPYPPLNSDGCSGVFLISHSLDCKKGDLVMNHYNKLRDEIANLDGKDFTSQKMHDEPLIYSSYEMREGKAQPHKSERSNNQLDRRDDMDQ